MREQVKVLEHHSHTLSVFVQIHFFSCQVRTVEIDMALCGNLQKVQRTEKRGFSTSGRTYNNDYLTFSDLLVHPV